MISKVDDNLELAGKIKKVYYQLSKIHNLNELTNAASIILGIDKSKVLDIIWDEQFNDPCHSANLVCAVGIALTYLKSFYTSISYSETYKLYRIEAENGEFVEIPFGLLQIHASNYYQTENDVIIKGRINEDSDLEDEWNFRNLTFKSLNLVFASFNIDLNKILSRANLIISSFRGLPTWRDVSQTGRDVMATRVTEFILWYNIITSRCDFIANQSHIPTISEFKEI